MKHSKMKSHPHDTKAAMPQFNEGHWQKDVTDVNVSDMRYGGGDFGQEEAYKKSVDGLSSYAKSHKAAH